LGNCLRNTASIAILADHLGVDWDIDLAQSESSASVNKVMAALFPGRATSHRPGSYPVVSEMAVLRFLDVHGTTSHPLVEAVTRRPRRNFGMHHIYAFRPSSMTDEEYLRRKLAFYQAIALPGWLREEVRCFARTRGILGDATGCHIRHTDNLTDTIKRELKLNTPVAAFISRLRKLGDAPVLLCSDDARVTRLVPKSLPEASIILPNVCSEDPQLWQPLYEMLLLGHTRRLIGSMASTFSYEACFWRGIDLEIFRNRKWDCHKISEFAPAKSTAQTCLTKSAAVAVVPKRTIARWHTDLLTAAWLQRSAFPTKDKKVCNCRPRKP
jgi:hypothetical protein